MDLSQLQAMGAFVSRTIFKREVEVKYRPLANRDTWADRDVPEHLDDVVTEHIVVYVRKRSSADFLAIVQSEGEDAALVSILRCVCLEDGSPVFPDLDTVRQLQEWLMLPLLQAVNEVNQYDAKKTTPRVTSGAALRSPSVAGVSRSGRRRFPKKSAQPG